MLSAKRLVFVTGVVASVVFAAGPAAAVVQPTPVRGVKAGTNTQLTLTSTGNGQGVSGFLANASNPFDPVASGYPPANPTTGFTARNEGFAGVINATPTGGGAALKLYCIDILTETNIGVGYELGTWDAANVPNVGFVARLLTEFYPNTNEPAALTDLNQKAAAVQAAIWFFSDRYVLNTSDPLHNTVAAITNQIRSEGPLVQPPPPTLTITPPTISAPAGSTIGPYTVTSPSGPATVAATGATMFGDAAATQPIANGTSVPSGTKIWLKATGGSNSAVLLATATATVPTGNVYLYDGNTPGKTDAQKLILAQSATLRTTVSANAEFLTPGSLMVTKTIAGAGAGQQGAISIEVTCNGTLLTPVFTIPAKTPAGNYSHTYTNIPAGSVCSVVETADGHTALVTVRKIRSGQNVTIPAGGTATANITDTYDTGALVVNKTITGPGAGHQSAVTITVVCGGTTLAPFTIPAGTAAGTVSKTYTGILAGTVCTVTETVNGANTTVTVTVTGNPQSVVIAANGSGTADLTDTYQLVPGELIVDKTIAGPGAGQQGAITIEVTCNGTLLTPVFTIPAGTVAGTVSQTYMNIPAGSVCSVVETADGHTANLTVTKPRSGQNVTIPPGGTVHAPITDTYEVGSLIVNKTITGFGAGRQAAVTITVVCGGVAQPTFTIPAGTAAGTVSKTYTGILAGTVCTVTETANGANTTVTVVTVGSPQNVTVGAGGTGTADLTDTYQLVPGELIVDKTIAGTGAGLQGAITIEVTCNGTLLTPVFTIPAGTPAGTVSQTYMNIPAGSVCSVVETADGHTATLTVAKPRSGQNVTIPPGGTIHAPITDTYDVGALIVNKTITGPGAGHQGAVTITVDCGGVAQPTFTIPAGTAAGTVSKEYPRILAGTVCVVTEANNGASATVTVTTVGSPQNVTIGANGATANITDTYEQVPGSLVVTKTIAGPAAGQQGPIAILIDCGLPPNVHAFLIPPGTPGGPVPRAIAEVPAGSTCVVTEVIDGGTSTVTVVGVGSGQRVVVNAGATAKANLTDTFHVVATTTTPTTAPTVAPTSAPMTLPNTGAGGDSTGIATGALLAGAVGVLLVLVSRRRAVSRNS